MNYRNSGRILMNKKSAENPKTLRFHPDGIQNLRTQFY